MYHLIVMYEVDSLIRSTYDTNFIMADFKHGWSSDNMGSADFPIIRTDIVHLISIIWHECLIVFTYLFVEQ